MTTNLALKSASAAIETAAFKDALDKLKQVVEKRNTIPILDMIHITSDNGTIFLSGTDLDLYMTIALPANVEAGMNTTVGVHVLFDLVKTAPKGSVTTLTPTEESTILVDFGGPAMKLHTLAPADFPTDCVSLKPDAAVYKIAGSTFFNGLDATQFAISTEETRYYLNGVFFHNDAATGELRMVTTDGHRLALQNLGIYDITVPRGAIVPRKTIKVLHKLLKGKGCPSELTLEVPSGVNGPSRLRFQWGNITIESKMVDGTFPDYPRVIPSDSYTEIVAKVDAESLIAGVKQVSAVSSERGRAVKLTFTDGDKLKLTVNNPDLGSAIYDLPISYERLSPLKEGDTDILEIGFNASYFKDALETAGKGEVTLRLQDASSPIKILGSRQEWVGVLMPMRV
jgi:DNA polymerase-3 subunit beta